MQVVDDDVLYIFEVKPNVKWYSTACGVVFVFNVVHIVPVFVQKEASPPIELMKSMKAF